jgi:hypothetical protein
VATVADAVARNLALRAARGLPPVIDDPAVWRIVASVLADHAPGSAARTPVGGRKRGPGVLVPPGPLAAS